MFQTTPASTGVPYLDDSLNEFATGEVTNVLQQLDKGEVPHASERIFDAVMDRLTAKAAAMIRRFPKLKNKIEADELVSEFQVRLLGRISAASVENRRHFFALAHQQFEWILLDMLKKREAGTLLAVETPDPATGPATKAARQIDVEAIMTYVDHHLDAVDAEILRLRVLQGLTFEQIGKLVDLSKSSVCERYKHAQSQLLGVFR